MRWSDIPMQPTRQTLRGFAALSVLICAGMSCWQFVHERHALAVVFGGLALVAGSLALVHPPAMRPLFVGMLVVTFPLNWLVSHLVLAIAYYCLFTPLAIGFRLFGRDALARKWEPSQETYWEDKPPSENVRGYFRPS